MAICYFNDDYSKHFNCEYEKINGGIEVIVEYEIDEEIEPDVNGAKFFGKNTKFNKRDILIIDSQDKMNCLLKDAYYSGHKEVWGTPDGKTTTKFFSHCYFYHKNYNKLTELPKTPKSKKIRIYSNIINDFIGHPSLYEESLEKELIIKLQKEPKKKTVEINSNNIKTLTISDDWHSTHDYKTHDIVIKLDGYIEIETFKRVNYDEIYKYIKELLIYIQLLRPDKCEINKVNVCINDIYYGFNVTTKEIEYKKSYIENSVQVDLLTFLSKCYSLIPYRKSKNEIWNIPYIIFDYSRNLEDTFLMLYRTIECYYKMNDIVNNFIDYSIRNNYKEIQNMNDDEIENLSQQIISLRNHYIHSGYYIKNNCLKIKFKDIDEKTPNPKNYTDNNVDINWIYEKTKILYSIVIDIIFSNMLGYEKYNFERKI